MAFVPAPGVGSRRLACGPLEGYEGFWAPKMAMAKYWALPP